jgi:hypothetical protein
MPQGVLAIRDRVFSVTSATLMGYVTTIGDNLGCKWHLDIGAERRTFPSSDPEIDLPDDWQPSAIAYHLQSNFRSWRDFEGAVFRGDDEQIGGFSVVRDETAYQLTVYCECGPINDNRLEFTNRNGTEFDLLWVGKASLHWGDYGDREPFRVETKVTFTHIGLSATGENPNTAEPDFAADFATFMNAADFRMLPIQKRVEPNGKPVWDVTWEPVV